jgi:uncharacterized protein (DUF362 family)
MRARKVVRNPSPFYRQVQVPPMGCGGIVASQTAAEQEEADMQWFRGQHRDSLIPWKTRPDLRTVSDALAYPQRRGVPGSEAFRLKQRIVAELVERSRSYKFGLLDLVLEQGRFWEVLERRWEQSTKPRDQFVVLIKPNTMMAWAPYHEDPANVTDPELVLYLIDRLVERGFCRNFVAEAQNVYSYWYCDTDPRCGRTVIEVYRWKGMGCPVDEQGYSLAAHGGRDGRFRLVDLTQESEGHPFRFEEHLWFIPRTSIRRWLNPFVPCAKRRRLGEHPLAPTLRDADFRISFAANKTHISSFNTLTLKNIFGCLPYADKFLEYHSRRAFDWPTIILLREFPFHFGIIDAIVSADGVLGYKADYFPRVSRTIIAGEDLVPVDMVGSLKMGLDPLRSRIIWLAAQVFGFPVNRTQWIADDKQPYPQWINVPRRYDWIQYWGERWYWLATYLGQATSEMDPYFRPRPSAIHDQARPAQRLFQRVVRPAMNIFEGWARKPSLRRLSQPPDRPAKLRRRCAALYT